MVRWILRCAQDDKAAADVAACLDVRSAKELRAGSGYESAGAPSLVTSAATQSRIRRHRSAFQIVAERLSVPHGAPNQLSRSFAPFAVKFRFAAQSLP